MDKIKKALENGANIGYIVAGYPRIEHTKNFLNSLDECALDIVEIGIPYSDPLADGPVVFNASFQAVQNGVNTDTVFEILSEVETKKPLILLVYFNLIFAYGMKKFIKKCAEAGISGLIIPDLPFEENEEIFKLCEKEKIALIPLISITSEHRAKKVLSRAGGFIYAISAIGVTGTKLTPMERLKNMLSDLKKMSDLPVAVGFGIRTNEDIRNMRKYADGVILGTSIVKLSGEFEGKEFLQKINELFK